MKDWFGNPSTVSQVVKEKVVGIDMIVNFIARHWLIAVMIIWTLWGVWATMRISFLKQETQDLWGRLDEWSARLAALENRVSEMRNKPTIKKMPVGYKRTRAQEINDVSGEQGPMLLGAKRKFANLLIGKK